MPHYYSEEQTSPLNLKEIRIQVKNISFSIYSGSGVFSKNKLDKGTELLLKSIVLDDKSKVLDLGCGIGVVGIFVKLVFPTTKVVMSEVNRRAVLLAKKNAKHCNVEATIVQSDGLAKIKDNFNAILLNPPQVAGKDTCFRLIEESYQHLEKKGKLFLVARHNKGGKTLSGKMHELFGNVEDLAKGSGYRVYISQIKN